MAKTFDVSAIAAEEAVTIKLRDGKILRGKDLLPEVVDLLGAIVDRRAQEDARDEVEQRRLVRLLTAEETPDEEYANASAELTALTTRSANRGRQLTYEQLAAVFKGEEGEEPLTSRFLQEQIPLPAARRIADELTRQILGQSESTPGKHEASNGSPTRNGSTAPERS